ncbi:MAG: hypothetical protein JXB13_15780 [Phycisphaerae bacterium]|nr:hypothetical protein [Phycisphaerae bacterium]
MRFTSIQRMALAGAAALLLGVPVFAGDPIEPGIIFDFDTHTEYCDPDYWSFFGYPTTDFGSNGTSPDRQAVSTTGNWTTCDAQYGFSNCQFLGSKHGGGRILNQPLCQPYGSGIEDADLNLSLGTGITMMVKLVLPEGDNPPASAGTPGVRLQFQLVDTDFPGNPGACTTAVLPGRNVLGRPYVNRMYPLSGEQEWETITIWFAGLDWSWDAAAIAGIDGFDISDICSMKCIWRRGDTSSNRNTIIFDEITLIDDPPVLWADADLDQDVDLTDFAMLQECFGADLAEWTDCLNLDANRDGEIGEADYLNFNDCMLGSDVTTGFYPWCY